MSKEQPTPSENKSTDVPTKRPSRRKGQGVWITLWAPLPIEESARALKAAGTIGFAIYAAICKQRFMTKPEFRSAFFCSENNISYHCGVSPRRIRQPLRELEDAGLVRISRPQGIEKVMHQASKITLLPVLTSGNKQTARPDDVSGSGKTDGPVESGHKVGSDMSVNAESPYRGTHTAVCYTALGGAVSTADELRGGNQPIPSSSPATFKYMDLITNLRSVKNLSKKQAEKQVQGMRADGSLIQDAAGRYYFKAEQQPA
jgi:hypothetical protein